MTLTQPNGVPRVALAARGISKSFNGTVALEDFDLEMLSGEVHALLGGNGSGKSTFIKILAGVYRADAGTLQVGEAVVDLGDHSPHLAAQMGLRFVHQDLGIIDELTVAENLFIGHGFPVDGVGRIRWRDGRRWAAELLVQHHVDVDPGSSAGDLSTPQKAMVAIARALQGDEASVLVLDEPTAALPPEEASLLLTYIRQVAEAGHAVLMVTHRLDELRPTADRVTSLRDGRLAGTALARGLEESDLAELILGRKLAAVEQAPAWAGTAEPMLRARGLSGGPIRGVELDLRPGEVTGIAGLLGSGRTELLALIYGAIARTAGSITLNGQAVGDGSPADAVARGMVLVAEDRKREAIFPEQSVAENMVAGHVSKYFRGFWLRDRQIRREVQADMRRFLVKAASQEQPIESLSGGNQQKVVIARALRQAPKVLLLDEPTQGIDVGAREDIYALIREAAEGGAAILVVSSEFEELARVCHRVLVLSHGRLVDAMEQPLDGHQILERTLSHTEGMVA